MRLTEAACNEIEVGDCCGSLVCIVCCFGGFTCIAIEALIQCPTCLGGYGVEECVWGPPPQDFVQVNSMDS